MNKTEYENIINKINDVWLSNHIKTNGPNIIESINSLARDINNIPEVTDTFLGDMRQLIFKDFDGDQNYINDQDFIIKINNITINAKIKLIPADFGYNIVLCLKHDPRILESLQLNEEFSIRSFAKELKKCKSFDDIKNVFKNYTVEATLIGTMIALVLCNFNLSDSQIRELGYINNTVLHEQFYVQDEDEYFNQPWELLCDDTEVTVYHAKKSQCNNDVQHTASLFKLNLANPESHKIIAMERTMMQLYDLHYGDLVKIEGAGERDGVYQIQDTMNKRFKGKHKIDILINNDSQIGKWNNVKIYKLNNFDLHYYNELKTEMADALNQAYINQRQNL